MCRQLTNIFIISLTLILLASASFAQGGYLDDARNQMERTDQLIERAKEAVYASNSPAARMILEQAIALHKQSIVRFQNRNFNLAKQLSYKAQQKAQEAIAAARQTEENQNTVLFKLEKVAEQLERIRSEVGNMETPGLKSSLETAGNNLDRAWEFYRAYQFRPAWKLANQVENAIRKIMQAANRSGARARNYEQKRQMIQQRLQQAENSLAECQSERGEQLMIKAHEAYNRAEEMANRQQFGPANKALQQARKFGEKVVEECAGGDNRLNDRLERLNAQTERLAENIDSDDHMANQLMNTIRDQLRLAAEYLEINQTRSAAASLKAAELSLKQLERYLSNGEL